MHFALAIVLALPLAAETAPLDRTNAVEVEKQRYASTVRDQLPTLPDSAVAPQTNLVPFRHKLLPPLSQSWNGRRATAAIPQLRGGPLAANGPCAVPLKNVLRPGQVSPPMRQYRPPRDGYASRELQVPAPPCEDAAQK